jgi:hypothetical protein
MYGVGSTELGVHRRNSEAGQITQRLRHAHRLQRRERPGTHRLSRQLSSAISKDGDAGAWCVVKVEVGEEVERCATKADAIETAHERNAAEVRL